MTAAVDSVAARFVVKQLELRIVPSDPHAVSVNRLRLRRVLANLLDNAWRHSHPGGTVIVDTASGDERVKVSITDKADGITEDQFPHVFDRPLLW